MVEIFLKLIFKNLSKHVYNSLSTINDYSDSINLSDLAVKMLQEDLNGLRITSSIGMDVHETTLANQLIKNNISKDIRLRPYHV